MAMIQDISIGPIVRHRTWFRAVGALRHRKTVVVGGIILLLIVMIAIFAPLLGTVDPLEMVPTQRLRPPSAEHWFGTDALGRDVYSRLIYGSRISLIVGVSVAVLSISLGLAIGLVTGFLRRVDGVLMRVMDGFMSIPPVMLAIALMALIGPSVINIIIAITAAELPRTARLVRGIVLSLREQPFVEAAIVSGASLPRLLVKHILPNTIAPLVVQATYVWASAMIVEAVLNFVGAGTPPNVPSWGGMISDGRMFIQLAYHLVILPGVFLSIAVLAVNLLGDGLRDILDPNMANRS